jgi:hypothetical protein
MHATHWRHQYAFTIYMLRVGLARLSLLAGQLMDALRPGRRAMPNNSLGPTIQWVRVRLWTQFAGRPHVFGRGNWWTS